MDLLPGPMGLEPRGVGTYAPAPRLCTRTRGVPRYGMRGSAVPGLRTYVIKKNACETVGLNRQELVILTLVHGEECWTDRNHRLSFLSFFFYSGRRNGPLSDFRGSDARYSMHRAW